MRRVLVVLVSFHLTSLGGWVGGEAPILCYRRVGAQVPAGRFLSVRRFRYVIADVFTDVRRWPETSSRSSPTARPRRRDDAALAREMNLSETVFVLPAVVEEADVRIRIFTPAVELPFAGHPTLGSAFVLGGPLQKIVIRLETGSGVVPVELEREGPRIVFGRMEQPIPTWSSEPNAAAILAALGVESSGLPVERYDLGPGHVYVELGSAAEVAGAAARPRRARARDDRRRQLLRARRRALEDADVRAEPRRRRGPGDRVGRGAARDSSRTARADRVRRADRDLAGR